MINELISALLQVIVFSLIPLIVYLIRKRTVRGFPSYIGLKRSNARANLMALLVVLVSFPLFWLTLSNPGFREIMTSPTSVSGRIREMGMGLEAVSVILIAAVIKTALAEEILFRGFLAKRLIAVMGFQAGNITQAVIFGAIHAALFFSLTSSALFLTAIFFFPALGAYLQTWINEKLADGSIVPGWITHATSNILSYSMVTFLV